MDTQIKNKSDVDLTEIPAGKPAENSQWAEGNLIGNRSNRLITNDDVNSKSNEEKLASDIVTLNQIEMP